MIKQSIKSIPTGGKTEEELLAVVEASVAMKLLDFIGENDIKHMETLSDDGVALYLSGKVPNINVIIQEEIRKATTSTS